jgi:hypothetical protein
MYGKSIEKQFWLGIALGSSPIRDARGIPPNSAINIKAMYRLDISISWSKKNFFEISAPGTLCPWSLCVSLDSLCLAEMSTARSGNEKRLPIHPHYGVGKEFRETLT